MAQLPQRKLAVIMFMDIVGYTSMVQESEQKALEFVRIHMQTIEEYAAKYNGNVVNYYGDASMSMFDSAVDAVKCAVELQIAYHNTYMLPMRIGLHMGDVVLENDTIYGNGVNIAARLESLGIPGSVLISGSINTELDNQDEFRTKLLGKYQFKNVADRVKVYAVEDDQLVSPGSTELRSDKGHFVNTKRKLILAFSIVFSLLLCAFLVFEFSTVNQTIDLTVLQEKIFVPPFKNYSGNAENDYVGEMAAHRITKELFQIDGADVIDFQTSDEIAKVKYMSFGSSEEGFTKQSGAVNILEGNFSKYGADSLMFSALIKRQSDGAILHPFPDVFFSIDDPISGISNLINYINGYWQAKDAKLTSFPKLDAYKLFLKAKSLWFKDDDLAKKYLLEAMEIDSNFYELPDLLLSLYYNHDQYEDALELLDVLSKKLDNMNKYERIAFYKYRAIFTGDNLNAFNYSKLRYERNPKDLFRNTSFMANSNDMVNDFEATLEAFNEIDINALDISNCEYCEVRLRIGIIAAMGLNKKGVTKDMIKLIPEKPFFTRTLSVLIRFYAKNNMVEDIEKLILDADEGNSIGKPISLRYVASRELFLEGKTEDAQRFANEILDLIDIPNSAANWAYYFLNKFDKSHEGFLRSIDGFRDVRDYSQLGVIAAKQGNMEKAWEYIANIEELEEYNFGDTEYYQARIYLHLGEKERALQLLEASFKEGAQLFAFNVFENDPDLISLRDDPEFNRIIFPMN